MQGLAKNICKTGSKTVLIRVVFYWKYMYTYIHVCMYICNICYAIW